MILHIVNKSPFTHPALQQCLRSMGAQDSLILIEDGTLLSSVLNTTPELPEANRLFILIADADARGQSIDPDRATPVSYAEFVALAVRHDKSVSWL